MFLLLLLVIGCVNSISFKNIADDPDIGLSFTRTYGKEWFDIIVPFLDGKAPLPSPYWQVPIIRQHPGVAILDYDNDGDLDIFVSQGPGKAHSLFSNQWIESGSHTLSFKDVGIAAGFGDDMAVKHDGSGVCFGDIDNDGYNDILILGRYDINLMYANNGDGTFSFIFNNGISLSSKEFHSVSCSFGDIDNDGLIDVVIGNGANVTDIALIAILSWRKEDPSVGSDPFKYNEYNELYHNNGDRTFSDISLRIRSTVFDDIHNSWDGIYNGKPTITWAIEMVDINADGYIDIVHADDTIGFLPPYGVPKGIFHLFFNDGTGHFSDHPQTLYGHFMGNSAGDLNCDGDMDLFISDYGGALVSRWYFGDGFGRFEPYDRELQHRSKQNRMLSPFGWGNAMFDYDLDGDLDVVFHGGMGMAPRIIANNPGVIYENIDGCMGEYNVPRAEELFDVDPTCVDDNNMVIKECTIHVRRSVRGLAIGDLNNDGFYDIITTSDEYYGTDFPPPYIPEPTVFTELNDPYFQDYNFHFEPYINRKAKKAEAWRPLPGDLAVEISSADNNNNYFDITVRGSKGILECGSTNRDAIGAILTVDKVTLPIEGGSSHLSQHSLQKIFGFGKKEKTNLLIKYPYKNGGYIVNKLNDIRPKESIILYEIPCDYESRNQDLIKYKECVMDTLCELERKKRIYWKLKVRLYNSAMDENKRYVPCKKGEIQPFCANGNAFRVPQYSSAIIPK